MVGDVVELSASADCELPVSVHDMALFGEDSSVAAALLVIETGVCGSRTGCCPRFAARAPVSGPCLTADSSECCLSALSMIFSIPFKASI